jgi:acyl-CoA reductase-like NAD-dependent aldehyde dehydrogenase
MSATNVRPTAHHADRWLADHAPFGLLIGGEWVPSTTGQRFTTADPATGVELASIATASAIDVDRAVDSARAALTHASWAGLTGAQRARLLWAIADELEAHINELAELETLDQGKTFATGRFAELPGAIEQFRYYAGFASKVSGTSFAPSITYQPPGRRIVAHTVPQPVGVVAAIVPWNSPLLMACMKLAPALAAGCTVVLKPAEDTPLSALRLGELLLAAGLPAGVVNILTGAGEVGAALARHAGVDKVTFTGSTEVGKQLVRAAAGNLKRLTLELGGKSPAIILDEADVDLTIAGLARGIFANAGQVCVAGSRIYVQRAIYEQVTDGLVEQAAHLHLGHGLDPSSDLGPLVSARHAARVQGYLDTSGAEIRTGGRIADSAFFQPTVLTGVEPDQRLMREEIFGPVAAITPFDDVDEVISLANDTRYGLAASVWTRDLSAAYQLSDRIEAGTVWVNCHSYFSPELVKGGHKESGWGYENGPPGLANYLEYKTVCLSV